MFLELFLIDSALLTNIANNKAHKEDQPNITGFMKGELYELQSLYNYRCITK